jgi:type I restriction enzyme S subunit
VSEPNNQSLPKGWVWATVEDTGQYVNGLGFKESDWGTEGYPIIRIQNLTDKSKPFNRTTRKVDENYIIEPGDILVSWSATLDAFIWDRETGVLNQHIFKVFPDDRLVEKRFLYYLLRNAIAEMKDSAHLHGSTMKHINRGPFLGFSVLIPPLAEQHRIVAEIETQLTRLDASVAALKRAQANLKRYRAAVLKAACEGRLLGPSGAETPPEVSTLPSGWKWTTVEGIALRERGSITDGPFGSNLKTEHYTASGPRVLRLQNIGDGIFVDAMAHISDRHFEQLRKHEVVAGDVVIAALGETLPRSCIIPPHVGPAIVKADCIRVRVDPAVALSGFVNIALNAEPTRQRTTSIVHGVGRPRLNLKEIKAIAIPLPPLTEQHRIVEEVERRLSVVEEMEKTVAHGLKRAERLRQAILRKAFAGELVPQDPADEPASVLLERIRAERAANGTGAKRTASRKKVAVGQGVLL